MNCQALRWQWLTFYKVNLLKFIIHAYRKVQQILSIQLDTLLSKSRITTTQFMKYIISFSEVCSSRLNLFKGGGCSVAQSCPTLRLHGPQPTRLPCPSLSPAVCSDPCPLSQWCHPTISSFAPLFSSCPQYFPALGSFPTSWLFASGRQVLEHSFFELSNKRTVEYIFFCVWPLKQMLCLWNAFILLSTAVVGSPL